MSGFNPLKEVINAIPIPEGRLTEVLRVEGMSKIYQQKHHTVNALKYPLHHLSRRDGGHYGDKRLW